MKRFQTDFLVPRSSFWTGLGSILNLPGSYYIYNEAASSGQADAWALGQDFGVVGQDIEEAIKQARPDSGRQMELPLAG